MTSKNMERSAHSLMLTHLFPVIRRAGLAILELRGRVGHTIKSDGTPVTEADEVGERIICDFLSEQFGDIPVVSEENKSSHSLGFGESSPQGNPHPKKTHPKKTHPKRIFLVDALDGTKSFVTGEDSFTVNIGLVENGAPVLGVIYIPASDRLFAGVVGEGAVESPPNEKSRSISVSPCPPSPSDVRAVTSCHHGQSEARDWLASRGIDNNVTPLSSSQKFCEIACGSADIYPCFGKTREWDTAAGDAILRSAGGSVIDLSTGAPMTYQKPGYRNGHFVATGGYIV